MMEQQRGAVTPVMNMSLFLLLLLSGLPCSSSGLVREYYYINTVMSWPEAQSYCRERFTDLATVDSMDDVNRLLNIMDSGYSGAVWIGLKRTAQSRWGWSNGENTISQYNSWLTGQPDGLLYKEFCAFSLDGLWHDAACNIRQYFTCYNETGYIKVSSLKSWTEAQSYCRQYHTDLATVHSSEEQNQINALFVSGQRVWIGLFLDPWEWSDQWSLFFRNWAAGYTSMSSGTGGCVAMETVSGKWVQSPCTEQHPFICYADYKKQIVRLSLSCGGKCSLNDPSLHTVILNEINKKLKSVGLDSSSTISWRKDEGGEMFHLTNKQTVTSDTKCDEN